MRTKSIKKMVLTGVMMALVFLAGYFTRIPTPLPGGYFNLGDAVIMVAAAFLGPVGGMIAGGIGASFTDIAAGAFIFAPITLVVKGIEGLVVGLMISGYIRNQKQPSANQPGTRTLNFLLVLALFVGAGIMVAGYFTGEAFVLSLFDSTFGIAAAAGELIANLVQGVLSVILAYFLILILSKVGIRKYIDS